jgi:hypothetical protein
MAPRAPGWLRPGGVFLTECAREQADAAASVIRDAGLVSLSHNDEARDVAIVTGQRPA